MYSPLSTSFAHSNAFEIASVSCVSAVHSFLLLNSIPLHVDTTICAPTYPNDGHLGCSYFWATMNKMSMNIHVQVYTIVYQDNCFVSRG